GRRVASRTPSGECDAPYRARPTLLPSTPTASMLTSPLTTTRRESASASYLRPKPFFLNCCTSNVNPPPGFRRDDASSSSYPLARRQRRKQRVLDVARQGAGEARVVEDDGGASEHLKSGTLVGAEGTRVVVGAGMHPEPLGRALPGGVDRGAEKIAAEAA